MLTKKQKTEIKEHLEKSQNPLFFFDNDNDGLMSFLLNPLILDIKLTLRIPLRKLTLF